MGWHGGEVLASSNTYAIWWGQAWMDSKNASFGASDKIGGLEGFLAGFGGSSYAHASSEYSGTGGVFAAAAVHFAGSHYDPSTPPMHAPTVAALVAEVCAVTSDQPDPSGVYFVYTTSGAGRVSFCAWHSWGACPNGHPVQVAYMPDIDGLPGCDPQDNSGNHSQGLAALANVTAHELSESLTDPRGGGWFDQNGQENGDKCAWSFNPKGLVTLANATVWKLQGEWSNAAFLAGNGFANTSGQPGCMP
jgi:hypothetical protein